MNDNVKGVLLGTAEVLTSAFTGAGVCLPVPPLSALMFGVCGLSSLISVIANAIFKKGFDVDEDNLSAKLTAKSVSLLIGIAVGTAITAAILIPVSLEIALIVATVVAVASVIGAITAVIIEEAPLIFSYSSFSVNVGGSPSYNWSRFNPFRRGGIAGGVGRGIGVPARGVGIPDRGLGVPARGVDVRRR